MLGQVLEFLGRTNTKQGLMSLAQGHNAVLQVRLEPATLESRVKLSITELPTIVFEHGTYHMHR